MWRFFQKILFCLLVYSVALTTSWANNEKPDESGSAPGSTKSEQPENKKDHHPFYVVEGGDDEKANINEEDDLNILKTTNRGNFRQQKKKPSSALEKSYNTLFDQEGLDEIESPKIKLKQIGYDVFSVGDDEKDASIKKTLADEPLRDFDANFSLSPGDIFLVAAYGPTNLETKSNVDQKMQIYFPKVGVIHLEGLTYAKAEEKIRKRFQDYYIGAKIYIQMQSKTNRSVFVIGKVKKPGIKIISARSSLFDALHLSGGITPLGSLRNLEIRKGGSTTHVDLYHMIITGEWKPHILTGGEVIYVPPLKNTVAIIGEVLVPGIYELGKDSTLTSLINLSQGISPLGSDKTINIFRPSSVDNNINTLSIPKYQFPETKPKNFDIIHVLSRKHLRGKSITFKGDVHYPGTYSYIEGENLYDGLQRAGGPIYGKIVFVRRKLGVSKKIALPNQNQGELLYQTEEYAIDREILSQVLLESGDIVEVPKKDPLSIQPQVKIFGGIKRPGPYLFMENMNVFSLINMAGGAVKSADLQNIAVSRVTGGNVMHLNLDAGKDLMHEMQRIHLQAGDVVTVPQSSPDQILVQTGGEFIKAGSYMLKKGSRLSDLIRISGGLKDTAYVRSAAFYRKSVARIYEEQLKKLATRLETDLLRTQTSSVQASFKSQMEKSELIFERQERLISSILEAKSPGRVVIEIPKDWKELLGTSNDIILEDMDRLEIHTEPSTVNIIGQVNNPNTVVFSSEMFLQDYLDAAGGFTRHADKDNIFVVRVNGSVVPAGKIKSYKKGWLASRGDSSFKYRIEPGDTILVPEDFTIKPNKLQLTNDITQILMQIITSIGIAVVAF